MHNLGIDKNFIYLTKTKMKTDKTSWYSGNMPDTQIVDKKWFLKRTTEYRLNSNLMQNEREIISENYNENKKQNRFMRMFCPVSVKVVNIHNDWDWDINIKF